MVGEQMEMFEEELMDNEMERVEKEAMVATLPRNSIRTPECPIAAEVMKQVSDRAAEGMNTYGQTMLRDDISTVGWIDHTIEELLDAACYLTRLKRDLKAPYKELMGG